MELPIDHFRLLGVSPTTDCETVLRTLQHRLDRAPDQGFTHDALQARADLLQSSAELLSDDERREQYERELTAIAAAAGGSIAALEIPPSKEVGGLLLLMEAGQPQEAFEAASRGLQPPQAPALGSSREADLTLLAGLACHAAASDYRNQRRYEAAARTLQQGLQLLQRMGQLPEQRRRLDQELRDLLPYRVLDLISRDLSAGEARSEGIALLDQLVQQRGGLEGDQDSTLPSREFQPFFRQIRAFLTVQEQIDLFSRWAEAGSGQADLLTSIALTASGFVQRKPERIQGALQRLEANHDDGLQISRACQLLLLGQVEQAQALFAAEEGSVLLHEPNNATDNNPDNNPDNDPLARLCATCRDWLSREVLPSFRDLDADPDLEAWFADRDVQAYIDQQDRIRGRQRTRTVASAPATTAAGPESGESLPAWADFSFGESDGSSTPPLSAASAGTTEITPDEESDQLWDGPRWRLPALPEIQLPALRLPELPLPQLDWAARLDALPRWSLPAGAAVALGVIALGGWLSLRPRSEPPQRPVASSVQPNRPSPATAPLTTPSQPPQPQPTATLPLTAAEPNEVQLQALLEAWLKAKAAVLAGEQSPLPLNQLARAPQLQVLERQLQSNRREGVTEILKATVDSFSIRERTPQRIEAEVSLSYSDQRLGSDGKVLNRTPSTTLNNIYVFGRDGDRWLLVAYQPSR